MGIVDHIDGMVGAVNSDTNRARLGLCLIYFTLRVIRIKRGAAVVILLRFDLGPGYLMPCSGLMRGIVGVLCY